MASDSSSPFAIAAHQCVSKPESAQGIGQQTLYASLFFTVLYVAPIAFLELVLAVSPGSLAYGTYAVAVASLHYGLFGRAGFVDHRWQIQLVIVAVSLGTLHYVPWNSRKSFLLRFNCIEPGMSVTQVEDLLACCSYDARERQSSTNQRGYHHSRASRFDSDIGIVHFEDGRVTRREFLPD